MSDSCNAIVKHYIYSSMDVSYLSFPCLRSYIPNSDSLYNLVYIVPHTGDEVTILIGAMIPPNNPKITYNPLPAKASFTINQDGTIINNNPHIIKPYVTWGLQGNLFFDYNDGLNHMFYSFRFPPLGKAATGNILVIQNVKQNAKQNAIHNVINENFGDIFDLRLFAIIFVLILLLFWYIQSIQRSCRH